MAGTIARLSQGTRRHDSPSPRGELTTSSFEPDLESTHMDDSIEVGRGPRQWVEDSVHDLTELTLNSDPVTVTPKYRKLAIGTKPVAKRSTTMPAKIPKPARNVRHIPTRFTVTGGLEKPENTAQSFMLPDLPNIAELVSGVRKDGTPVFSKFKGRSRFTSATYERQDVTITDHARIVSMPLPDDEKAIFASLQLLKERVAELEAENARANSSVDRYASENAKLKRFRDGNQGDEKRSSPSINKLTAERDGLVTQLGVAFYTNEELKNNTVLLQNEVDRLTQLVKEERHDKEHAQADCQDAQARLKQSLNTHERLKEQWSARETELKNRIARRDQTIDGLKQHDTSDDEVPGDVMANVERKIRKAQRANRPRRSAISESGSDVDSALALDVKKRQEPENQDLTYLSFLDPNELSRLRKQLEGERRAAKETPLPRKSSLKDLSSESEARNVRIESPQTADAISYREGHSSTLGHEDTSAFILPDIVHRASASPVLVPVSSRPVDIDASTATVRPATQPAKALSQVLARLEAQISGEKVRLAGLETEYNAHDPAMGKRKRTALKEQIEGLIKSVEDKSEVVYGLYDVVEGYKAAGLV